MLKAEILETLIYIPSIIGVVAVGAMTLANRETRAIYKNFAVTAFLISLWLSGQYAAQLLGKTHLSLVIIRIVTSISLWIAIFGSGFIYTYIKQERKRKSWLVNICLASVLSALCIFSSLIVEDAWGTVSGIVMDKVSLGYYLYIAYIFIMFITSLVALIKYTSKSKGLDKYRNRLILYSVGQVVVLASIGSTFFGHSAAAQVFVTYSTLLFCVMVFLGMTKYQLFDVKRATIRTVAYVATLATLGAIYYGVAYFASVVFFKTNITNGLSLNPFNILLALILALIFQPIKRFFDRLTNRLFYRGEYDRDTFYREFGQILAYDTDLRLLLHQASSYIATNLKAEAIFFYIADRGVFGQNGSRGLRIPKSEIEQLANYYQAHHKNPEAIVASLVRQETIIKLLDKYKTQIVLPLRLQDQTVGYLFVGDHKSRGYGLRDIQVLESIVNELAIAIQNSLSVEEVRELNRTLQHRVDEATQELRTTNQQLQRLDEAKDEFMSIASHQLRTPLTTVKGYLDMVLDGDMGKITPMQKKVLSEAFLSSERMVQLINDFLNVSRLQTGKFMIDRTWADLTEVINNEMRLLSVVAGQRELKLEVKFSKNIPLVFVDIEKLRQVIINMIDNAIYYSNPNTTVHIDVKKDGKDLVFQVTDTGIGVPKAEQAGLFGKFFRASNARKRRPDGTGVGLFLARKVVSAHKGEMIFKSIEGKGSTFGFRLPIQSSVGKDNKPGASK